MLNIFTPGLYENNRNRLPKSGFLTQNKISKQQKEEVDSFSVAFKGDITHIDNLSQHKNISDQCIHYTYFFRNYSTLNFVANYVTKTFNDGANIADFGCSYGKETYSLAMLLKKYNTEKKYVITGYDVQPSVISIAKKGEYTLEDHENFLMRQPDNSDNRINSLIELFKSTFSVVSEFQGDNSNVYSVKPGVLDGVVDFKLGDIADLGDKLQLDDNTRVIIFKNAWYHLTGFDKYKDPEKTDLKSAEKVIKLIHESLAENGILVVGQLARDHLYTDQPPRLIEQNGKIINVYDSSLFHDVLRKNGFIPVFFEKADSRDGAYLPSVWQKAQ